MTTTGDPAPACAAERALTHADGLRKELNLFDGIAIVVGTIIGPGIFLLPHSVALQLDSLGAVLLVWAVGGILSLVGALSLAELGSMFPGTGGLCTYLRRAHGRLPAFLYAWSLLLNASELRSSDAVAALAVHKAIGPFATFAVSLLILVSILGSLNGLILTGPRVYYAMARDDVFPRPLGRVSGRYRTPMVALIVQGVWSGALAVSGTYQQLFTNVVFTAWIFYGLAVAAILVLRRTRPELPHAFYGSRISVAVRLVLRRRCGRHPKHHDRAAAGSVGRSHARRDRYPSLFCLRQVSACGPVVCHAERSS